MTENDFIEILLEHDPYGGRGSGYLLFEEDISEIWEKILSKLRAPVASPIQWPTMPPSKGQSPVLFEDGYAEGWAKCMDECRRAVSQASAPVAGEAQPVAVLRFERGTPGRQNEMPRVVSCNWMPDGDYPVYAAPQASEKTKKGG